MTRFWDSSGIVLLVVRQRHTRAAETWLSGHTDIVVWWATPVECASALARLMREHRLTPAEANAAARRLRGIAENWVEVEPTEALRDAAKGLVTRHAISAADALQLAAAMAFAGTSARDVDFVTFDGRLGAAARREGFNALGA